MFRCAMSIRIETTLPVLPGTEDKETEDSCGRTDYLSSREISYPSYLL